MIWTIDKQDDESISIVVFFESALCPNPHRVQLIISDENLSPPFRFHCDPKHPLNSKQYIKYRQKNALKGFEELSCIFGAKNIHTFSLNRCLITFVDQLNKTFDEIEKIHLQRVLKKNEMLKLLAILHFLSKLSQHREGNQYLTSLEINFIIC